LTLWLALPSSSHSTDSSDFASGEFVVSDPVCFDV
jgi:hypothetical protein